MSDGAVENMHSGDISLSSILFSLLAGEDSEGFVNEAHFSQDIICMHPHAELFLFEHPHNFEPFKHSTSSSQRFKSQGGFC